MLGCHIYFTNQYYYKNKDWIKLIKSIHIISYHIQLIQPKRPKLWRIGEEAKVNLTWKEIWDIYKKKRREIWAIQVNRDEPTRWMRISNSNSKGVLEEKRRDAVDRRSQPHYGEGIRGREIVPEEMSYYRQIGNDGYLGYAPSSLQSHTRCQHN